MPAQLASGTGSSCKTDSPPPPLMDVWNAYQLPLKFFQEDYFEVQTGGGYPIIWCRLCNKNVSDPSHLLSNQHKKRTEGQWSGEEWMKWFSTKKG